MAARVQLSPAGQFFHERLDAMFPDAWLEEKARETGLVKRLRAFNPVLLFWVLVLQSGVTLQVSLEGIRRRYNERAEVALAHSSFYERFTPQLVRFLRACVPRALEQLASLGGRKLTSRARHLQDILIQDSTVIRLHEKLAHKWPATRSRHAAAGVKLATVVSVVADGPTRVRLHGERVAEVKTLTIGKWVKDRLLLLDLGFFSYSVFDRIARNGGYFVSRLKENADPLITKLNVPVRGNSRTVEGEWLRDTIPQLKRQAMDVMAQVHFKRRAYRGQSKLAVAEQRVIAILNEETGDYHVYVTNLPLEFTAQDVASLYRARWEIELLFRELKKNFAIDCIPTANPHAVEALLWTGILTLIVHRIKFLTLCELFPERAPFYSHERHAKSFQERGAAVLLEEILGRRGLRYDSMDAMVIDDCGAFNPHREHSVHIREWRA